MPVSTSGAMYKPCLLPPHPGLFAVAIQISVQIAAVSKTSKNADA
jgi:hypothetical protein